MLLKIVLMKKNINVGEESADVEDGEHCQYLDNGITHCLRSPLNPLHVAEVEGN